MVLLKFRLIIILGFSIFLTSCGFLEGGKSNTQKEGYIFVRSNADYQEVLDSLRPFLVDENSFDTYAKSKDYPDLIKGGKYKIENGESNESLLNKLRAGLQEELAVRIKNEPTIYHLAGSVAKKIEADSTEIIQAILENPELEKSNDPTSLMQYFLPNTYNFYWATNGNGFVNKMKREYDRFWNEERLAKAEQKGMTPLEVTTLAAIVQMEAPKADEQARVAKAYLNRLDKGIKLQADPTSVYAYKLKTGFNGHIPRVYEKHLKTESKYNTYVINGLPPAPICLPNSTAIDAVLNPAEHDYIYLCADPDRPGYHNFTSDPAQHERNAAKYRKWLRENNIR